MKSEYGKYLVEYYHDGSFWTVMLYATSGDDAEMRVRQLQYGKVLGRVEAEVSAALGWLAKLWCSLRNL